MLQGGAAVTGSVLATILIGLLGSSPEGKLAGAVVGAAIPTFATVFLSRKTLHLSFAVVITLVALVVVYGGAFAFDAAADKETFPRPGPTPTTTPTVDPTVTVTQTPNTDGPEIRVTPKELSCIPECTEVVTIRNTGDELLQIEAINLSDNAEGRFTEAKNCTGFDVSPGRDCKFAIAFDPPPDPAARTASLDIDSNAGDRSVKLEGKRADPTADLGFSNQKCSVVGNELTVSLKVEPVAGDLEGVVVRVAAKAPDLDPPLDKTDDVPVGEFAEIKQQLPELTEIPVAVTVAIDSTGAVPEITEENNSVMLSCPP